MDTLENSIDIRFFGSGHNNDIFCKLNYSSPLLGFTGLKLPEQYYTLGHVIFCIFGLF